MSCQFEKQRPEILACSLVRLLRRSDLESQNAIYRQEMLSKNRRLAELVDLSHALVDNVSHEFRTPLAVLKEFIALLLDGLTGEINETQRDYLTIMAGKVNDLTLMVNDLLDTSRIDAGLLGAARMPGSLTEVIDLGSVAWHQRAITQKIELNVDCAAPLPSIYADLEKCGRVLTNLVINAMKFSPQGGRVDVRAERDPDRPGMLRVDVIDEGPGITPEHLEIIFDRFRQCGNSGLAAKGFGLGLSIVKELVQLNLGDVFVKSVPGEGSTFSFTVPVYEPAHVIELYLNRLSSLKSDSQSIALIRISVDHADLAARRSAADYINRSLRPFDLFLPTEDTSRWLILASSPSHEQILKRLRRSVDQAYEGLPSRRVPNITMEPAGAFPPGRNRNTTLIRTCLEELGNSSGEAVHV